MNTKPRISKIVLTLIKGGLLVAVTTRSPEYVKVTEAFVEQGESVAKTATQLHEAHVKDGQKK